MQRQSAREPDSSSQVLSAVLEDVELLRKKLADVERARDDYLALLQTTQAEFENYRKRAEREMAQEQRYANAEFARALLPVVDNLQRMLDAACGEGGKDALISGLAMVLSQLLDVFRRFSITPIDAEGESFDPMLHEAVVHEVQPDAIPGRVTRVLEPGYRLYEQVLRPARVIVAAKP